MQIVTRALRRPPALVDPASPLPQLGYPFNVTRFGFSDDSLALVDPLSPKHYPERGAHERKQPNK
jgi:hypothetical protein